MNVIFLEPSFPDNQRQFVRALREAGATVIGIGERPADWLDDEVQRLAGPLRAGAVGRRRGPPHRRRAAHPGPRVGRPPRGDHRGARHGRRARPRGVRHPGHVGAHHLPVPRQAGDEGGAARRRGAVRPLDRRRAPATRSGRSSPRSASRIIVKPRAARAHRAPSASTRPPSSTAAIARSGVDHGAEVAVEEFIEGHEGFYDTITIDGHVAHDFVTHYYPNVLEAMRTRWISPQFVTTNRIDAPDYDELKALGRRVNGALGIGTSATHMEWFVGPKGLKFSEIGCRPPGVRAWDLYAAANDIDIYREWANADRPRSRRPARRRGASPPGSSRCGPTATAPSPATTASTPSSSATASGSSTPTCRRRARRPSRSRPATWPTRGCACATRTTTGLREMLDDVGRTVQVRRHVTAIQLPGVVRLGRRRLTVGRLEPARPPASRSPSSTERHVHVRLSSAR